AVFDQGKHQPHPVHDGGNHAQVVAIMAELIGGELETLLEQVDRVPICSERVVALPEAVEQLAEQSAVAAFAGKPDSGLAKLDSTALLADEEVVIAPERGVPRAAQLVSQRGDDGIELVQGARNPIGLAQRQQRIAELETKIHGMPEIVGSFRQLLQ